MKALLFFMLSGAALADLGLGPKGVSRLHRVSALIDVICLEPKDRGLCCGSYRRYYFNTATKTCEEFVYSGCNGTENNFETVEECRRTCRVSPGRSSVEIPDVFELPFWLLSTHQDCKYPGDTGPCEAYTQRFFYNTVKKSCEQFIYGGCGGNANNFLTYTQCEDKCKTFVSVIPRA